MAPSGRAAAAASAMAVLLAAVALIGGAAPVAGQAGDLCGPLDLTPVSTWSADCQDTSCVEVLSYDISSKHAAVVLSRFQAIAVIDYSDPASPVEVVRQVIPGGVPNSVATYKGYFAASCDTADDPTAFGFIVIYDLFSCTAEGCTEVLRAPVAAMPDNIYWRSDGTKIYAACEGEPASQDDVDSGSNPNQGRNPHGAMGIVTLSWDDGKPSVVSYKNVWIQQYVNKLSDAQYASLVEGGFRVDPRVDGKANAGHDIEPEYIAVDADESTAWVTLQENNAMGRFNLKTEGWTKIIPLGWRDLSTTTADVSDRDGGPFLRSFDNVYLWRQPDTIKFAKIGGRNLLFMADEGDSKEEALRVNDIDASCFDATAFPDPAMLANDMLGRLNMDPLNGLVNGYDTALPFNEQCGYDKIIGFGGRSWSIRDANTDEIVYDSADTLIKLVLNDTNASNCWNCDRDENAPDGRSDNAGVEPEAIEVFQLNGCYYAAVGLERQGGFMMFDVNEPTMPKFLRYTAGRNFLVSEADAGNITAMGNLAPEQILFVSAKDTVTRMNYLLVTYEVSGTVVAYQIGSNDM